MHVSLSLGSCVSCLWWLEADGASSLASKWQLWVAISADMISADMQHGFAKANAQITTCEENACMTSVQMVRNTAAYCMANGCMVEVWLLLSQIHNNHVRPAALGMSMALLSIRQRHWRSMQPSMPNLPLFGPLRRCAAMPRVRCCSVMQATAWSVTITRVCIHVCCRSVGDLDTHAAHYINT
jgi:hypothetical protein